MMRGEQPLTDEQLQLAFRHLARPGWPATLEAALADPRRGPCVRGLARSFCRSSGTDRPARTTHYTPPTPLGAPPVPPTPRPPPKAAPTHLLRPRFDARKAAANDRED